MRSEVPPDVKYVVFVDIYSGFIYNVTVTTHFGDLGVDRVTLEEDVVTLEYSKYHIKYVSVIHKLIFLQLQAI